VSYEEEGTGHYFCPSHFPHSTAVLWQREYAKNLANKSGAFRVVNQMFAFDNGSNAVIKQLTGKRFTPKEGKGSLAIPTYQERVWFTGSLLLPSRNRPFKTI
jgi:hypothetical protein